MNNRIYNTLLLLVFSVVIINAQVITASFDQTAIGAEGTSILSVVANPPGEDQQPGEFQVLIDFPNDGSYVDITPGDPVGLAGAPDMDWTVLVDGGGSDTWLGTNINVVPAIIGGGTWEITVEGVGPDSGGNQVFSVASLVYAEGGVPGFIIDDPAGIILDDLLPVEFSMIDVRNTNCESVDVVWQTQSEINNDGFFIERSIGSVNNFESLDFVKGRGNSNQEQSYSFADDIIGQGLAGNIYYRIKQVDIDGRYDYSEIVSIKLDCNNIERLVINAYPNPTMDELYIDFKSGNQDVQNIIVKNSLNQLVETIERKDNDQIIIDMTKYTAGIYYVQIVDVSSNVIYSDKIIKVGN